MEKPFYGISKRIDDDTVLASVFNKVLKRLDTCRIMSAPYTFKHDKKDHESKCNIVELFYDTCLWEIYLHEVISRLHTWCDTLDEYFNEYEGSWKYYACSHRISEINEYGGEENDYNDDGSVRTEILPDDDLTYYTVISDLVIDDYNDIVQDTDPEDLKGMFTALSLVSGDIMDMAFKQVGIDLPMYRRGENGEMVPMTFSEKAMNKALAQSEADDLILIVYFVCSYMQTYIGKICNLDKFSDNKDALSELYNDTLAILDGRFKDIGILSSIPLIQRGE